MFVVKVWGLGETINEQLGKLQNELQKEIAAAVTSIKELCVVGEDQMVCLFPPDLKYRNDEKIIIEVTGTFFGRGRSEMVRQRLAAALGLTVHKMFPKALVECCIHRPFDLKQGFWSSQLL